MNTDLAKKMIDRANKDNLNDEHIMRVLGEEFEMITKKYFLGDCSFKIVIGTWARARKCWCDYTGEDLI